jgi:hypothetical protein
MLFFIALLLPLPANLTVLSTGVQRFGPAAGISPMRP